MSGPFASLVEGKYRKDAARDAAKLAAQQQRAGQQLLNELDFQPMYASENVPTYQRSQSPIARSYLESMLAGNNPQATFSGAPNAAATKARQQGAQDQMFGTMQERVAKQRALETDTPWWKVTTPTRQVNPNRSTEPGAANWTAENSELASRGVNKTLSDSLSDTGTNLEALNTRLGNKKLGRGDAFDTVMVGQDLERLLQEGYGGNATRMAADIRAAGGYQQLMKQKGWA